MEITQRKLTVKGKDFPIPEGFDTNVVPTQAGFTIVLTRQQKEEAGLLSVIRTREEEIKVFLNRDGEEVLRYETVAEDVGMDKSNLPIDYKAERQAPKAPPFLTLPVTR